MSSNKGRPLKNFCYPVKYKIFPKTHKFPLLTFKSGKFYGKILRYVFFVILTAFGNFLNMTFKDSPKPQLILRVTRLLSKKINVISVVSDYNWGTGLPQLTGHSRKSFSETN